MFSGTRREVHRARRARGRGDRRRPVVERARRRRRRRCRAPISSTPISITCARCFPKRRALAGIQAGDRLRQRRDDDRGARSCSRASASRPSSSATSPTAATSICDCGSTHPEAAGAHGRRARLPDGRGVRRRRRSRDLRRSPRPGRQRRRGAADVRRASCSAKGGCKGNAIVATVMSNIGLEIALRALGIELVRCAVGDKYVMEEMLTRGLSLGGEQSGPHHLLRLSVHRRRPVHGAERAAHGRADRPHARRSRVRSGDLSAGAAERARPREGRSADRARRSPPRSRASKRASPGRAGCSSATRAPSRCCA